MSRYVKILLMSLLSILVVSCARPRPTPVLPAKPILHPWQNDKGGICLDKEDTAELLHYILQLEECCKQ